MAIQAWKVSCRKLGEARSGNVGDESLLRLWEEYKSARRREEVDEIGKEEAVEGYRKD